MPHAGSLDHLPARRPCRTARLNPGSRALSRIWLVAGMMCAAAGATVVAAGPHAIVIRGGRVIDPESGLDAVCDLGIDGGTITAISTTPLVGHRTIAVEGRVVAPGFIDLHQHAWDDESLALKVRDGVTSALELEIGTSARLLGHHVRDRGDMTLPTALAKLSLMPARRLEARVEGMRRKGRICVGADADLVVFDPGTVAAGATYDRPREPSVGIEWVIVAGTPVVAEGSLVADAFPGRPLRAAHGTQ